MPTWCGAKACHAELGLPLGFLTAKQAVQPMSCWAEVGIPPEMRLAHTSLTQSVSHLHPYTCIPTTATRSFQKACTILENSNLEPLNNCGRLVQAQAEVDAVLGERSQPTVADFMELKYLMRCVNESMRLYPHPPVLLRRAQIADTLPGQPSFPDCCHASSGCGFNAHVVNAESLRSKLSLAGISCL